MYSDQKYKISLLDFHIPFHPKDMEASKTKLNRIFNQIQFTLRKLNFIVERRCTSVNEYRGLQRKYDDLKHKEIFDKKDTKKQQSEVSNEQSPVLMSLTIDTEIYFVYVKVLLDSIADLIYYYENLPKYTEHDFTKLYNYIIEYGCKNPFVQKQFKEKLQWYPLSVQTPRNKLTTHDQTTSGMSWNDHGIDISIGKSGDQHKEPETLKELKQIIENHSDEFTISDTEYIQPILREIIREPMSLNHDEIKIIKKISNKHAVFPYVKDVQQNLQEFLNFMQKMFSSISVPNYW